MSAGGLNPDVSAAGAHTHGSAEHAEDAEGAHNFGVFSVFGGPARVFRERRRRDRLWPGAPAPGTGAPGKSSAGATEPMEGL